MADFTALNAETARSTSLTSQAATALKSGDQPQIDAVTAQLKANNDGLAAALAAAAPPPAPAPAPTPGS